MKIEMFIIIGIIVSGIIADWYFSARDRRKILSGLNLNLKD